MVGPDLITPELLTRAALAHREADPVTRCLLSAVWKSIHDRGDLAQAAGVDKGSRRRAQIRALREAADLLAPSEASAWVRAGLLAQAVERFELRVWKVRTDGLGPVEQLINVAFCAGRFPRSREKLYELLRD